jgi:hypothetical protein
MSRMSILIQNVAPVSLINNTYFEKKFTLRYIFKVKTYYYYYELLWKNNINPESNKMEVISIEICII